MEISFYGVSNKRKFAIIKNGELYSLVAARLGLTLAELNDDPNVVEKLKALAERELSQAAA